MSLKVESGAELYQYIHNNYSVNAAYNVTGTCYTEETFRNLMISTWLAWYTGYYDNFHYYWHYNGTNHYKRKRRSMKMAKQVCEDKANMLLNEKLEIIVEDKATQELVDNVLKKNNFKRRANNLVELTNALGSGAFVEYPNNDVIDIDFITADMIFPIAEQNGEVISCGFASIITYKQKDYVFLTIHLRVKPLPPEASEDAIESRVEKDIPLDFDGYMVENLYLKRNDGSYQGSGFVKADIPMDVEPFYLVESTNPLFQIIKPNIANNICIGSPLGMSSFGNALDILEGVDVAFDSFINEFITGKKRIFVHDKWARIDLSQNENSDEPIFKPIFSPQDTEFFSVDMDTDGKSIIAFETDLRIGEHVAGINQALSILSKKCGLGNNFYRFEVTGLKTATEVISSNQDLINTIRKDEEILREKITNMIRAIIQIHNQWFGGSLNIDQEITVNFDDSIFEDVEAIRKAALIEYGQGLIDKIEYFMRVYKMTEKQARAHVEAMEARQMLEVDVDAE